MLARKMLSSSDLFDTKRMNHVHKPRELLVCIDIQLSTLRSLFLQAGVHDVSLSAKERESLSFG